MLRITNRSGIWNVRDVAIVSDDLAGSVLVPIIRKRETIDVEASFLFERRGIAHIKSVDLYTRYPFGFFLKKRRIRLSGDVVVFPRLLDEESARERFRPVVGEHENANRPGPGTEIHSFREYVRGDSLRHIYWKKSASLGRWIMKQTELDSARAVHVVFDPYKPRDATDEAFEEVVSAAATYLFYAARRGLTIFFTMPRVTITASEAESAGAAFRALALVEPSHEPVTQVIDPHSIVFGLRRDDELASA